MRISRNNLTTKNIWSLRFALQDAKASIRELSLLGVSIIIALACLVALLGFRANIEQQINDSARALVGADLVAKIRGEFSDEARSVLNEISKKFAEEVSFTSMAYVPKNTKSKLVLIKAVSQNFPVYGQLISEPIEATQNYQKNKALLIDQSLALQLGLEIGDMLNLGNAEFPIAGFVVKAPGVSDLSSSIAPRIYLPLESLESTALIGLGSRARSTRYIENSSNKRSNEELVKEFNDRLLEQNVILETLSEKQTSISNLSGQVNDYLSILAFLALLLGALGLSGSLYYYFGNKRRSIAALLCLGASSKQIRRAFSIQILLLGTFSIFLGVILGILAQPLIINLFSSVFATGQNIIIGYNFRVILSVVLVAYVILFSFSLLPLSSLGNINPLEVLRPNNQRYSKNFRSVLLWVIVILGILFSSLLIIKNLSLALISTSAAMLITSVMYGASILLKFILKKIRLNFLPFSFRQGIANLYRPYNQTAALFMILGLGIFSSCLILLGREVLIDKIAALNNQKDANIIAFDVQSDQLSDLEKFTKDSGLTHLESIPIVSMRLKKINSIEVSTFLKNKDSEIPKWALTRTYRSTYRDSLSPTETLIRGRLPSSTEVQEALANNDKIPVTIGERISNQLRIGIGDSLNFNVQGMPLTVKIVGVRKIDWQRFRTNFFVVFPSGILEEAPKSFVVAARSPNTEISAIYQRGSVEKFSNVSIIDLALAQETLNQIFDKIKFAVIFLASLSIITSSIILLVTLLHSQIQREREYSLLRVLGASKKQLRRISLVEYSSLAIGASILALSLSSLLFALIQVYIFKTNPQIYWGVILILSFALIILVNLIASLSSQKIYNGNLGKILRI